MRVLEAELNGIPAIKEDIKSLKEALQECVTRHYETTERTQDESTITRGLVEECVQKHKKCVRERGNINLETGKINERIRDIDTEI